MTEKELIRQAELNAKYAKTAYELGNETGRRLDSLKMIVRCTEETVHAISDYSEDVSETPDTVKLCLAECMGLQIDMLEKMYTK